MTCEGSDQCFFGQSTGASKPSRLDVRSRRLYEAAGRTAYLAGFHAAQAFFFERIGRIYKTHSGVRSEFSRLLKDDPRVDDQLRGFLGMAYNLKEIADYETGPASHVSAERAQLTIEAARRFVDRIAGFLS